MGLDASILAQHMYGQLYVVYYLRTSAQVRLSAIPPSDKVLHDLGTFNFAELQILSVGSKNRAAVVELLRLIERLDNIHT